MPELETQFEKKPSLWQKKKVTFTGATLFSLGILIGFLGGWFIGRQKSGQSLMPVPVEPSPFDIIIPYASPSPNAVAPDAPGSIEPAEPSVVPPMNPGVACTMDAKICPDGSYVGRQAPNCEFAPCPTGKGAGKSGSAPGNSGESVSSPAMPAN